MPHLRIIDKELWKRVKVRRIAVSQRVAALRASLHLSRQEYRTQPEIFVLRAVGLR